MSEENDITRVELKAQMSEEIVTVFYQIVRLISVTTESTLLQDLPIMQIRLLRLIDEEPGKKVADLAVVMGLSVSRISRMLAGLVSQGLVERIADRKDKRVVRLYLTDASRDALQQREIQRIARMEACLEQMSSDTALKLVETLHLMKRAAEKSCPQTKNERGSILL